MNKRLILPAFVIAAASYFALFGGDYGLFAARGLERQRVAEQAVVQELRAEIETLRAQRDSLLNDSATIERIARERYGMIRPGERLYRFTECPPTSPNDSTHDTTRDSIGC